jgi:hypothetical protein
MQRRKRDVATKRPRGGAFANRADEEVRKYLPPADVDSVGDGIANDLLYLEAEARPEIAWVKTDQRADCGHR